MGLGRCVATHIPYNNEKNFIHFKGSNIKSKKKET